MAPAKSKSHYTIPGSIALGELEVLVLEHLWTNANVTVKEVHNSLREKHDTSVKTIQSTMERLYRKKLLSRTKHSHSYRYSAVVSKEDLLGNLINDLVGRFNANSQSSAAAIISAAEQMEEEALAVLEQAIRERRKESNQ